MISFIVIGRNEGQYLDSCFKSIRKAIYENNLIDSEIIYVDSNSTDNSIDIAIKNEIDKIYMLTEIWNAAIGRNIGAINASGDDLFFIDGDMELVSNFIPLVIDDNGNLKYDLVSGNLFQIFYNKHGRIQEEKLEFRERQNSYKKPITGGSFFIKKEIYKNIGGMDNRFWCSEDPELGLRLAKKGVLLQYLPATFIKHHTDVLKNPKVTDLKKGGWLYGNILMYKLNLFNKFTYKRMLFSDSSLIVLIFCIICFFMGLKWIMILYPITLLIRIKFKISKSGFQKYIYLLCRDILVAIMFIPFYKKPIPTANIKYQIIK